MYKKTITNRYLQYLFSKLILLNLCRTEPTELNSLSNVYAISMANAKYYENSYL